jgi:hypothetical protein
MSQARTPLKVLANPADMEAMRVLADAHERTLAGEIRRAISLYVAQHRHPDGTVNGRPTSQGVYPNGRPPASAIR